MQEIIIELEKEKLEYEMNSRPVSPSKRQLDSDDLSNSTTPRMDDVEVISPRFDTHK